MSYSIYRCCGTLAGLMILAGNAAPDAASPSCARIAPSLNNAACRSVGNGFVTAAVPEEADRLARYVEDGAKRFRRFFGGEPPLFAIVQGGTKADRSALKSLGVPRALPFPTPLQYEEAALASMIRPAEAQARAAGLGNQQIEALKVQTRQRWLERNPLSARQARDAGVVPHELGHLWLIERYWPGSEVDSGGHYGGPGPDWLDETAAVMMEDDQLAASRRKQFAKGLADDGTLSTIGVTRARLLDLGNFLKEEHPMREAQEVLRTRPSRPASGVTVLTGEEARLAAGNSVNFYLQARMFADWAIEQSGNERIFDAVARALAGGMTLESVAFAERPALATGREHTGSRGQLAHLGDQAGRPIGCLWVIASIGTVGRSARVRARHISEHRRASSIPRSN